ncbi:MAG: hypothetical protein EBU10_05820, partial [Alphaproteobacteria bacterium]|nr:hypothetical protein [Alphaproteobacteria bacterium]
MAKALEISYRDIDSKSAKISALKSLMMEGICQTNRQIIAGLIEYNDAPVIACFAHFSIHSVAPATRLGMLLDTYPLVLSPMEIQACVLFHFGST